VADWQQIDPRPTAPAAQALLGWMQLNAPRLREILEEEAEFADDLSPAGDAAVRAHLRFVAEALAANGAGATGEALDALARDFDEHLTMEYVDLRFLFFDGLDGEIGAHIDDRRAGRLDSKADGWFWHVGRELSVFQSDTRFIDQIKCGGSAEDEYGPRSVFNLDQAIE